MGLQGTLCPVGIVRRFALRTGGLRLDAYLMSSKNMNDQKTTRKMAVLSIPIGNTRQRRGSRCI
jgi:hypothetical protein